jgi:hypothetical protein
MSLPSWEAEERQLMVSVVVRFTRSTGSAQVNWLATPYPLPRTSSPTITHHLQPTCPRSRTQYCLSHYPLAPKFASEIDYSARDSLSPPPSDLFPIQQVALPKGLKECTYVGRARNVHFNKIRNGRRRQADVVVLMGGKGVDIALPALGGGGARGAEASLRVEIGGIW